MSINCGICGLPNVGKSTLFAALTAQQVPMENYPFCTIEPNRGIVPVPDTRLQAIADILEIDTRIPAVIEFVDIAGLVAGASDGEGLGNQFLANIREVGMMVHVVRCFRDDDVVHVAEALDPVSDIETIHTELALADLATVERSIEKSERQTRSDDKATVRRATWMLPLLSRVRDSLSKAALVRDLELEADERDALGDLHLLTAKPELLLCNVGEDAIDSGNDLVDAVVAYAGESRTLTVCGKLEAEIAAIEDIAEREAFLEDAGIDESGLHRLARTAYAMLGLRTFFTENGTEVRAWTFHEGDTAPAAAGVIHTDFEQGFIRAEVYHWSELVEAGSVAGIREHGALRIEGRDYPVQDGDVMKIRFQSPGA